MRNLLLKKMIPRQFVTVLKCSTKGAVVFSSDPIFGSPQVSLDFKPQQAENTLSEIFEYLKSSDRECFIALDEFQQVTEYPETGLEAAIRSYAQFCPNIHFIFSGCHQRVYCRDCPLRISRL